MDMIWYGHKYGFLQDDQFDFLWRNCSARSPAAWASGRWGSASTDREAVTATDSVECRLALRHFLAASSRAFSQSWTQGYINDLTLFGPSAVRHS